MDNTKTAEEIKHFILHDLSKVGPEVADRYINQAMEEYAAPLNKTIQELEDVHVSELHIIYDLKKRIEELEANGNDILKFKASLVRIAEMKFDDPSECSAAFERLSQLLNPSTNEKQDPV